ncbi:MAG: RluA family pseudouridine synthase [Oscillospiraceae bacterium]|nr:RluA family pseudouridine synthase [Oscillospiraceae bacterium]
MTREIFAGPDAPSIRADVFLADQLEGLSRNAIQRAIETGEITFADGGKIRKNYLVSPGDRFLCNMAPPAELKATPQDIPLDIAYEDDALIVVNKPRGMVVHPAPGHPDQTLVNALLHHCAGNLAGIGGVIRPGIVHRLDKDTSGLLLVAKSDPAHQRLTDQLRDRKVVRIYEAVVIGRVGQDTGTIDLPIGRHPTDRKRMSTAAKVARDAVTHYTVLTRYNGYTHIRCELETGRTHQIRAHLTAIGHPVLGDLTYGRGKPEKGISGQCLHARTLIFDHPITGERLPLTTDLPDYFTDVLSRLGLAEIIAD